MNISQLLIRLSVSFVLAFAIGFERQWRKRSVGFRTYALVCVGAFLFETFSIQNASVNDSSRIAAQVVSGIGFLGAGVILKDGSNIKGLNTAATLWCSAAIGVLCASGLLIEATIGTVFILISNIFLRYIARKMDKDLEHGKEQLYTINVKCYKENKDHIRALITKGVNPDLLVLKNLESYTIEENKSQIKAQLYVSANNNNLIDVLINKLNLQEGIISLGWTKEENKSQDEIDEEI